MRVLKHGIKTTQSGIRVAAKSGAILKSNDELGIPININNHVNNGVQNFNIMNTHTLHLYV